MDLFDIRGKNAIVTGGTRGLGYKMAEGYLEAGCQVVIVGTSPKVYEVAQEFRDRGYDCQGVMGDLGDRQDIYRVFQECVEKLGGRSGHPSHSPWDPETPQRRGISYGGMG